MFNFIQKTFFQNIFDMNWREVGSELERKRGENEGRERRRDGEEGKPTKDGFWNLQIQRPR